MTSDPFLTAWISLGEPVCNLARMMWEDDGCPEGREAEYVRRARADMAADLQPLGHLEGDCRAQSAPDPTELGRPMSDDENVDEAVLESMDASDPPAHSSPGSGAPAERTSG